MFGFKLHNLILCALPLFALSNKSLAADKKSTVDEGPKHEEASSELSRSQTTASPFSIHGGFGFIRAYKTIAKHSLGSNGLADVKISYLTKLHIAKDKKIHTTLRYFPFQISPMSDDSTQQFSGVVSAYAAGAEFDVFSSKKFDFLASLEVGAYQAHLAQLIPVTESDRPIKSFGELLIAGVEMRYKLYEKFHFGPRLYFGGGTISFTSLLLNASFYF